MTGELPVELGQLTNLQAFIVGMNNFTGTIPAEFGNLTNLVNFYLFNTEISGDVPDEFANLTNLKLLWLANNQLTGLPDLSGIEFDPFQGADTYTGFCVSGNNLRFDDIEPNLSVLPNSASYNPQKSIIISPDTIYASIGEALLITFEMQGAGNEYQWFLGNTAVSDKSFSPDFNIASMTAEDFKKYKCKITNPTVPGLTLTTSLVTVLDRATSISASNYSDVKIFANRNIIHFESNKGAILDGLAEVYDLSGKKILSRQLTNANINEINTNNITGAYIVKLITRDKIYTEKVIIR